MATRLAAKRLREAGINLEPLLRDAGLFVGQIDEQEARIGVASQIKFLELAAAALKDQLLGFRLARDGDLRLMGLLYYAAASSETLSDALGGPIIVDDTSAKLPGRGTFDTLTGNALQK